MTWSRRCAALMVAAGLALASVMPATAEDTTVFTLDDEQVSAVSAMVSDSNQHVYWVVNAGNRDQRAYAVDGKGKVTGAVQFAQPMSDPQALAYREQRLYVGDIGDAGGKRQSIHVYRFQSPDPSVGTPNDVRDIELQYSDRKARDARAMLVDDSGRIYVITHEEKGGIWATNSAGSSKRINILDKVADAPGWVTDATWLPDGNIAVRNYTSVQVIDANDYSVIGAAATPYQAKGEALSLDLTDSNLLLASAGQKQPVFQVATPTSVGKVPAPAATPPPPPPATPGATASAAPGSDEMPAEEQTGDDSSRRGTFTAIGLAAGVAVLAGLIVYVSGRPTGTTKAGRRRTTVTETVPPPEQDPDQQPEDSPAPADGDQQPVADEQPPSVAASPAEVASAETAPVAAPPTEPTVASPTSATASSAATAQPIEDDDYEPVKPRRGLTIVEDEPLRRPRRAFTIVEPTEEARPRRGIPPESEGALIQTDRSEHDRQQDLDWLYPPERD